MYTCTMYLYKVQGTKGMYYVHILCTCTMYFVRGILKTMYKVQGTKGTSMYCVLCKRYTIDYMYMYHVHMCVYTTKTETVTFDPYIVPSYQGAP